MPLQGDLKEFGVPEILQLLEQQGKTGCLRIQGESVEIDVYFETGRIQGVFEARKPPPDQILESLTASGFLSPQERENIGRQLKRDLRALPEILRASGILEPREFEMLLKDRAEEILFSVFQKRRGAFSFEQEKLAGSEWVLKEPLPVEPLILEGLRRTDEWPLFRKRVGSLERVPRRKPRFGDAPNTSWKVRLKRLLFPPGEAPKGEGIQAQTVSDSVEKGEAGLSASERRLYGLVDGRRRLGEILSESGLGEYSACKAFLSLLEGGWVEVPAGDQQREREGPDIPVGSWQLAKPWLLILGLIGLLLCFQLTHSTWRSWIDGSLLHRAAPVARLLNLMQRDQVEAAIGIFRRQHGAVPRELKALLDERLLRPHDLSLWGHSRLSYEVDSAGGYRLLIVHARE